MDQSPHRLHKDLLIIKKVDLQYLLYLPKDYLSSSEKWPVILFLHGRDQRGEDTDLLKIRALPQLIEGGEDFPFLVIAPQCPNYYIWPFVFDGLIAIVDEVISNYSVDENRIYLTGLSMGGFATWDLAMEYPRKFAAIAPVCGAGSKERVETLKHVPVWAFHGAEDDVVPLEEAREVVDALQSIGGNAHMTVYPGGNHDAWTETYQNPGLYEWFLKNSL